MTKYLILLLITGLTSCVSSSPRSLKKTDLTQPKKVQVIQSHHDISSEKGKFSIEYFDDYSYNIYKYNEQNVIADAEFIDDKGEVYWNYESTFNSSGNVTTVSIFVRGKLNTLMRNKIVDGLVVEEIYYDDEDQIKYSNLKEYNSDKTISKKTDLDAEGKVVLVTECDYKEGKPILMTKKLPSGKVKETIKIENNSFGDAIKEEEFNPEKEDTRVVYYEYEYDQNENWIRQYIYNKDRILVGVNVRHITYSDENKMMTESDILGEWFILGKENNGFTFNENHTFYLDDKSDKLGSWSFNAKKSVLTLKEMDGNEREMEFNCELKGGLLLFSKDDEEKVMRLEKRSTIIEDKYTIKVAEKAFLGKWKVVKGEEKTIEFLPDHELIITSTNNETLKGYWGFDFEKALFHMKKGSEELNEYPYFFEEGQLKFYNHSLEEVLTLEPIQTML
ncbi:hypothetical protein [Flammeovirga sp. EKP202]|uniref:hypothetical protein n=1 Tax=Flammeovirga sp. EKP202 TaxID=2770592 RepID=UPI00165FECF8|nr:hypothetical protein [Flammeovirga sp. EKP202]MBD0401822.1 hypothetical protein [Flammeovirga sp. EKP202]